MGKNKKDKKKGKGAEKTAQKTDKKLSNKQKKQMQAMGEDDIETIISQIEAEERKRSQVTEHIVDPPSRRINFTFLAHPDKDELILYGGEYFDGQKTFIFKDLFFYNISSNKWTLVKAPNGPPPRCGHQMVTTSMNKGQLWVFGGEYASPTQLQFYHYRDLWVYHLNEKKWEKVMSPNGPSARSGHRMVLSKKNLVVFGGFHDNLRDYKYFNDVYVFNIESYKWNKVEPSGTPPGPRSGCCMVPLADGKILIYGGYMKEKIKKDVDKGHVYSDAFILAPDKHDTTGTKFVWQSVKLGGIHFSPRCSMPITLAGNSNGYCFGGVFDTTDDDENLSGVFYNDLFCLNTAKLSWFTVMLNPKKETSKSTKEEEKMEVEEEIIQKVETTTLADDGIFKVTLQSGGASSSATKIGDADHQETTFQPSNRMNCGLAVKHGILYLYGGFFEEDDKEIALQDFYALDLKKLDEWKVLIADDTKSVQWLGSPDNSTDEEDNSDENSDDSSDASDKSSHSE